jgi:DNA-directed RNA polymerase subunit N (RpoN/RPB10)
MCYSCGQKIHEEAAPVAESAEGSSDEEEISCPNCKTMISRDALMCYACGMNVKDSLAKAEARAGPEEDEKASGLKKPQIFVKKIVKKKTV